jgi:taurine dioxygenase
MELKADETSAMVFGEPWHQDATADEEPPLATMLYMHQIPENGGGDTCFSSGYAAYEALSEPVKELLQGLHAVHELGFGNTAYFTKRQQLDSPELPTHVSVRPQYAVHPVVHTHPTTARKTLFVNKIFTRHVIGVSPLESRAILEMLFQQIEQDQFKCRIKWRPWTIALWDNRVAYHRAIWDYYPGHRYGHRITLLGGGRPL